MFCPNCGKTVQEGATFCTECGEKIITVQAENNMNASANQTSQQQSSSQQAENGYTAVTETAAPVGKTGLAAFADNKNIRIGFAVALVVCIFFMPFFSIMGVYSINGFDMIKFLLDGLGNISGSFDMSDAPVGAVIGCCAFVVGMVVFMFATVLVLIGAIKNKKSMEKSFALIGLIGGIALFVGMYVVLETVKDVALSELGSEDYGAQAGVNAVMTLLSPFKILGTGFWGGIVLYISSFVLSIKRTDA